MVAVSDAIGTLERIRELEEQNNHALRLIAMLVREAGGRVVISRLTLEKARGRDELVFWHDPLIDRQVVELREK